MVEAVVRDLHMLNQPLAWAVFHYHDNYGMGVWVGSCSRLMTEGVRSKLNSKRKVGMAAPHLKHLVKQNDIGRIAPLDASARDLWKRV